MHLAVPVQVTLFNVDGFLRKTWVECCDHLSAFTIKDRYYPSAHPDDPEESGMSVELRRVLRPGMVFSYRYDFGSTTELRLKVLGLRGPGTPGGAIQLLARNNPPAILCDRCGKEQATEICIDCACRNGGWLCASCAEVHECSDEMRLPVVNSPRVGVCAYTGP